MLQRYIEPLNTEIFNRFGVFFAFSNEQLNEQKQPNVTYVRGPSGMIIPKDKVDAVIEALKIARLEATALTLSNHTPEEIIEYELGNYECYYTGDITPAIDALAPFDFTPEQIHTVYRDTQNRHED